MPWTDEAWLRSAFAALKQTLDVDARTRNEMVQFLLDEGFWDKDKLTTWESAVAKFNSCMNPNKAEFFKIGELWALMKRFGRHQLFLAMAADLGYEVRRVPTEERREQLLEQLTQANEQHALVLARIAAALEQLNAAPRQQHQVAPGMRAQFSLPEALPGTAVQLMGCP
ncbi:phage regulatory CII family protein [Stenotrophomonas acidaminiphila]|uniref:phage regulatory CII family protein n=1 Tax=Stenotrophomonas acidaminiphila TaxID=128780 RepID=UPI001FAF5B3D|nr:phage regulatory CII family protein [Stenotrophomonas acidaminiphila]